MSENLLRALQTFKLDQHHEKIHADPNELIEAGFPGNWLPIHGARVRDGSKNRRDHRVVDCSIASAIAADGEGAFTMGRHV